MNRRIALTLCLVVGMVGLALVTVPAAPAHAAPEPAEAARTSALVPETISAGYGKTCGLRSDGTVACWGWNDDGQSTPSTGTFVQVSAGGYHTCGLRSDGTVACWGQNGNGQATPPAGTFVQVSAGEWHTCGLKTDGTVSCWGYNYVGETTPPAGTFLQVSAGTYATCGVRSDGTVACWGSNIYGRRVPPTGTFVQVSAGLYHNCGLRSDGTAACWGYNGGGQATPPAGTFGQVSTGDFYTCGLRSDGTIACWGDNSAGQTTPPGGVFLQVSAGGYHACGLRSDGTVACWGSNHYGESTPQAGSYGQRRVDGGYGHTCAVLSDGTVACWGMNNYGQASPPTGTFVQVSAGYYHTCGLGSDGTLTCWGNSNYGQSTPPAGTFVQVSAGRFHTCGLGSDGTVACWGINSFYDYGQASPPTGTFVQVSAGRFHTCGLGTDGTVACWGYNDFDQTEPPTGTFVQVSAGGYHTCGLRSDGTVACWGRNDDDQLTPPTGTFVQISAGEYHTCGLRSDGTMACWGNSYYGQALPPTGTFVQVSAGDFHTCGVRSDGTLTCWGWQMYGQTPRLALSPGSLPDGFQGVPYSQPLTVADGTAPYTVAVVAGALPDGIALDANNTLSGAPTATGTYAFTLQATDSSPMPLSVQVAYALAVTIPANRAPMANPGGPYLGAPNTDVAFDGSGSSDPDGDALTYAWTFGDGGSGEGATPTHSFAAAGNYDVCLTVNDGLADSDPACTTAVVNTAPVANPGGPYLGAINTAIAFDGSGSSDPDGDALTYAWTFGDGGSGEGAMPTHSYAEAGTYDLCLTVNDGLVDSDPACTTAVVNTAPVANPGGPYLGAANTDVAFDGSGSSDPDGDALTYAWTFGDGGSGEGAMPTHSYTAADIYEVCLTVNDGLVDSEPACTTAVVNTAPVANPGGPYLGAINTAIAFDGSGSSDPDGDALAYAWTFGDGGSGEGAMPTHSYAAADIYDVCLTVNDGLVDSDPACTLAVVYDPSAGFVTGGGWIDSPAGAYKADPALTGKATFGFVSKYKKGHNVPTGTTQFQFDVAGFGFYSETYDWLVVNQGGTNAQFKGSGTVNGALDPNGNEFKFMIWAGDGSPDTFRIKIWWEDNGAEAVVYDNGVDQPIGGGSIVIHTK